MSDKFEILNALPQGIFCLDSEYRITYWNQLIEVWTGIPEHEALGNDARDIFPNLKKKFYHLMIHQVMEVGSTAIFSYQLHQKLFKFPQRNGEALCIQSQVIRTPAPGYPDQYNAVFSLQDISGLIRQIRQNREIRDEVLKLIKKMRVTEEELRLTNEELQRSASTDPLTGLLNRRSLMFSLEKEVERHKRYKAHFSILLTDIDGFKNFNDQYGHACGDYILSTLGRIFNGIIRPTDAVCRWGGEEFLFLLTETDINHALQTGERIRSTIENYLFIFNGITHKVTLTIGISSTMDFSSQTQLINDADQALYHGKKNGKNRVVLYTELVK